MIVSLDNNGGVHHPRGKWNTHGYICGWWWHDDSAGVGSEAVGGEEWSSKRQSQEWVTADKGANILEEVSTGSDGLRHHRSGEAHDGQNNGD